MADKIELNADIKTNIGEVAKDAGDLASEFKVMGVSLNDIKKGFITVGATAKKSFATVKAGLMSTGIGALIIAIGSLVTYFTQTEKGAEKLKVAFAGISAAVSVIVDRIANFGGGIMKLFTGDVTGGLKDMKNSFKGIGEEIKEDVNLMTQLEKQTNALRDSERDLSVETANRRAEIEELKMIAEDVTKSEEERLEAATKAFNIEQDLLDKRVENAEKAVEIAQQQVDASHSSEEDLDNLAQLEIDLANIRAESATKQIELNNKINAIEAETDRKKQERHQREIDRIQKEAEERKKAQEDQLTQAMTFNDAQLNLETQLNLMRARNSEEYRDIELGAQLLAENEAITNLKISDDEKLRLRKLLAQKFKIIREQDSKNAELVAEQRVMAEIQAYGQLASALSSFAGDNKALAVASAVIDTYAGATKAFAQGGTLGFATSAAIIVQGLANVKRIMETDIPGAEDSVTTEVPGPQFVSGAFDLNNMGGGIEPEPVPAYVLTDDMTNSQNKLAIIRRRATI
tara:strand:- start:1257 stop:2807 length:1551 start_codon:yes stop_codon:yes gene_type:complete